MQSVDALIEKLKEDAQDADALMLRAKQALVMATERAIYAKGKVEGAKAAQAVANGDE